MVLDMSERITLIGLNVRHSELYGRSGDGESSRAIERIVFLRSV